VVARGWGFEVIAAEAIRVTVLGNGSAAMERRLSRHRRGEMRREVQLLRSSSLVVAGAGEYIVVRDCNYCNCLWRSGTISSPQGPVG
jgi:hypothetical protein